MVKQASGVGKMVMRPDSIRENLFDSGTPLQRKKWKQFTVKI